MTRRIDLNADIGEGCGDDDGILAVVTSCNIACGGHAGDAGSMRAALLLARDHGVAAGAHPSYPDRANFGRAAMDIAGSDLATSLRKQIAALVEIADGLDVKLTHVKPHGALYNAAARDAALAMLVVDAVGASLPGGALVGPPASKLSAAADAASARFIAEGFADRAYDADGALRDRRLDGAIIESVEARAAQADMIARKQRVRIYGGGEIDLPVETICLHGDSPGALASAREIRARLDATGVDVRAHT